MKHYFSNPKAAQTLEWVKERSKKSYHWYQTLDYMSTLSFAQMGKMLANIYSHNKMTIDDN